MPPAPHSAPQGETKGALIGPWRRRRRSRRKTDFRHTFKTGHTDAVRMQRSGDRNSPSLEGLGSVELGTHLKIGQSQENGWLESEGLGLKRWAPGWAGGRGRSGLWEYCAAGIGFDCVCVSHSWGAFQCSVTFPWRNKGAESFCGGMGGAELINSRRVCSGSLSGCCSCEPMRSC